jgi:hypothetical protein
MPLHDIDELTRQFNDQEAQFESLTQKKNQYYNEVLDSKRVAERLRTSSLEIARAREMTGMKLSEQARTFTSQFSRSKTTVSQFDHLSALERSERKLELKMQLGELEVRMRDVVYESFEWVKRATQAQEAARRAEFKLRAVPNRFRETPIELRRQLISVLAQRETLDISLGNLEMAGRSHIEELKLEVLRLRREIRAASSELVEVRHREEHWTSMARQLEVEKEPMRERVRRLKDELRASYGHQDALIYAAVDSLAVNEGRVSETQLLNVIRDYVAPEGTVDLSKGSFESALKNTGLEGSGVFGVSDIRIILDQLGVEL